MRLLADENVQGGLVAALRGRGHDVVWVVEDAAGSAAPDILYRAVREARILITHDTDFGDLIFRDLVDAPPAVILMRFPPEVGPAEVTRTVLLALDRHTEWVGFFAVVEAHRVRFSPLPRAT